MCAERLYLYMIADHFKDEAAKKKILEAMNSEAAETAVKNIQNFNEKVWNEVCKGFDCNKIFCVFSTVLKPGKMLKK